MPGPRAAAAVPVRRPPRPGARSCPGRAAGAGPADGRRRRRRGPGRMVVQAQRLGDRPVELLRLGARHQLRQVREPGAVGEGGSGFGRHPQCEPGLADTADPGQGDQAGLLQCPQGPRELVFAPDEGVRLGGKVPPRRPSTRRGQARPGTLRQHGQMQGLEVGPRIDAQLVGEQGGDDAVALQRFSPPPGQVQRPHPLRPEPLPQRVRPDQRPQLRHHLVGPAQRQIGVDPQLQRVQALLGQHRDDIGQQAGGRSESGSPRHRSSASRSRPAARSGNPSCNAARPRLTSAANRCRSIASGSTAIE